jgi:hypothetical protein
MDPPPTAPPRQLPLPLALPTGDHPPPAALPPARVWHSLPPTQRAACQRTLVRILQEVTHADAPLGEDLERPS